MRSISILYPEFPALARMEQIRYLLQLKDQIAENDTVGPFMLELNGQALDAWFEALIENQYIYVDGRFSSNYILDVLHRKPIGLCLTFSSNGTKRRTIYLKQTENGIVFAANFGPLEKQKNKGIAKLPAKLWLRQNPRDNFLVLPTEMTMEDLILTLEEKKYLPQLVDQVKWGYIQSTNFVRIEELLDPKTVLIALKWEGQE